jgi:uncharacterized membrane protein SpoIIM required for sporulation
MVLESLISAFKAEKNPISMFFYTILCTLISILLSFLIFKQHNGLIMLFLIVIACIPVVYNAFKLEENKDTKITSEKKILAEHSKVIVFLTFMFLGLVVAFTLLYVFLPLNAVMRVFDVQTKIMFFPNSVSGSSTQFTFFKAIFFNNIRVTLFSFLLAFLYGAGAVFIFSWNASIIAVAIGNLIRYKLNEITASLGFISISNYLQVFYIGFLRYITHGVLEMIAYFIGGLAGGIISVAVINHDFGTEKFNQIVQDASYLFVISLIVLIAAAFVEVYISFNIV